MIEVRYQPGATPMVFYRGGIGCGSAVCYVDAEGDLRTTVYNQTMSDLVALGFSLEVILPPGMYCRL